MVRVLVIDNSTEDCQQVNKLLSAAGYELSVAHEPETALQILGEQPIEAVLLDSAMPALRGVNFIDQLLKVHSIPIVIVSSCGHEEQAIEALQQGATSYVPKDVLKEELVGTLRNVLEVSQQQRFQLRLLEQMEEFQCKFVLENDRALIPPLVAYLQEHFGRIGICDESELMRIGIALDEALVNAIYHGNLDLDSSLREDGDTYYKLAQERARVAPYKDRRLYVEALISPDVAEVFIRDQGEGFDPTSLPDPCDPANMEKVCGRGVLLMRTFMDEVKFNDTGNSVILRKYRKTDSS